MIVIKFNGNGEEKMRYSAERMEHSNDELLAVKAYFSSDDVVATYTTFRRGDLMHEYYYKDRWYNIFALYDGTTDDRLKGWYCNFCWPTVWGDELIYWRDLALDMWIDPTGAWQLLDNEEYEALGVSAELQQHITNAIQELITLAESGELPR